MTSTCTTPTSELHGLLAYVRLRLAIVWRTSDSALQLRARELEQRRYNIIITIHLSKTDLHMLNGAHPRTPEYSRSSTNVQILMDPFLQITCERLTLKGRDWPAI